MKAWILSIVGVICLGILLEIVLPEGKTAKYIRGTFSLVVIFVIVSPLPQLFNKEWSFDLDMFDKNDESVVGVEQKLKAQLEKELQLLLAKEGYSATVQIEVEKSKVQRVGITANRREEYSDVSQIERVKNIVANRLKLSPDAVDVLLVPSKNREKSLRVRVRTCAQVHYKTRTRVRIYD